MFCDYKPQNILIILKVSVIQYDRLLEIHDNYPKYVLTTDAFSGGNIEGIKTMHIADFLLSKEY